MLTGGMAGRTGRHCKRFNFHWAGLHSLVAVWWKTRFFSAIYKYLYKKGWGKGTFTKRVCDHYKNDSITALVSVILWNKQVLSTPLFVEEQIVIPIQNLQETVCMRQDNNVALYPINSTECNMRLVCYSSKIITQRHHFQKCLGPLPDNHIIELIFRWKLQWCDSSVWFWWWLY